MNHRTCLLDRALLYLFSYDVEISRDWEELRYVPGGYRVNIYARNDATRVYHVGREATVGGLGYPAIRGTLDWGTDRLLWRTDDIELSEVQFTIRTDDAAAIEVEYDVVAYLMAGGYRSIVQPPKDGLGTLEQPLDWPVVTSPRFSASHPRYRWLSEHQGVGFGLARIVESRARLLTYDVYAMT